MSQDIVADALNEIMNCKRAGKNELELSSYSKFLLDILKVAMKNDYVDYKLDDTNRKLKIIIKELTECRAIKPRFYVGVENIEKYMKRFLPSRNFGIIIISTSSGLLTHSEAYEKNVGGSLVAYFY